MQFIGYTTDATVSIGISRNEVDPCTGDIKAVSVGSAVPRAGDVRNKWIWRASSTTLTTYTREYNITTSTGTGITNGGQILAGQYIQPVGEWIFPESGLPGTIPLKNDFSSFSWLKLGFGPDDDGNIWGPLNPSPGMEIILPSGDHILTLFRLYYATSCCVMCTCQQPP